MFKIIATQTFIKELKKSFDAIEMKKFASFKRKLRVNPYLGKKLRVYFVREFKTSKGKRAYFIIYKELGAVLFVSCSNKKNQGEKINEIFVKLEEYNRYVRFYSS